LDTVIFALLSCLAAVVAIPVVIFLLEVAVGVAALHFGDHDSRAASRIRSRTMPDARDIRVAVLVPAHDEGANLVPTIEDIKRQLRTGDRLLVVADNCSDDTALIASSAGAEVIERIDVARRGKGWALDFGVRYLKLDPPDIVIMVDADCRLTAGTIDQLSATCVATRRPVQALDIMNMPEPATISHRVAAFAWIVKNWLRPLGLHSLGFPCQLMGTGMAFPWNTIQSADLANGWIVEDLKLGLDLAAAGHPPLFCPAARVTSTFPSTPAATTSQRTRWEHGHIATILYVAPSLVVRAVRRGHWPVLALTLDLAVPPLSLLALAVTGLFVLACISAMVGLSIIPAVVSGALLLSFVFAVAIAWIYAGRDILPFRDIWSIAPYVAAKLGLYVGICTGNRVSHWVRTERDAGAHDASDRKSREWRSKQG